MQVRRQPRQRRTSFRKAGMLLAALVLISTTARHWMPLLYALGEQAAVLSVAVNDPQAGLALLEDRFAGDLYDPEEDDTSEPEDAIPFEPSEEESSSQAEETAPDDPANAPEIPEEYQGPVVEEIITGGGSTTFSYGTALIKNATNLSNEEVLAKLNEPWELQLPDDDSPKVLIFHTHATEAFEAYDQLIYDTRSSWRSQDNSLNAVAVGQVLTDTLNAKGIPTIHDTTQHDYPSYNGSYQRSKETIQSYLEKYPSIQVVIDIHRDAIQRGDTLVRPVVEINGKKAAQLMIISGCDDGTMNMPNWDQNLRFAGHLADQLCQDYPQLSRPVLFDYREYNFAATPSSLLIEVGSHGNTLEQVKYTAELLGNSLAKVLLSVTE